MKPTVPKIDTEEHHELEVCSLRDDFRIGTTYLDLYRFESALAKHEPQRAGRLCRQLTRLLSLSPSQEDQLCQLPKLTLTCFTANVSVAAHQ